ncbi:MAG: magnesium transporter [Planctomycetota bacterium JB042]
MTEPPSPPRETATTSPLTELLRAGDVTTIRERVAASEAATFTLEVSRLTAEERSRLLEALPADEGADILLHLPDVQAIEALTGVGPGIAAEVLHEIPSDERADLLGEIDDARAEPILAEMEPGEAAEARVLCEYEDDEAGGLMATEFLAFPEDSTVADVVKELRARSEEIEDLDVQYVYVTDRRRRLVGVLRLRDLLLARGTRVISERMVKDPLTVRDETSVEALTDFFVEHAFLGVPVIDAKGRMLGIVHRGAVQERLKERADRDLQRSQGLVKEELRSMPLGLRARRRLSWLSINILLNVIAASVIASFQDTLSQVIALAVFLPIISDMSGCSGNQAVAVSMRELSLGLVLPREVFRVLGKEVLIGIVNGLALGTLVAVGGWLWNGNPWFGVVVGAALAVNTLVAVSIGGAVPLLLKRLGVDPALASGPILTTVTDMCGFFLVLGLATAMLPKLV